MATVSNQPSALPPPGDGYKVHPKQRAVLQSDARYKILKWGRRAGKNVVAVIEAVEFARDPSQSEWGRDDPRDQPDDEPIEVWWVGRSYDQARKHGFEKVKAAIPRSWIDEKSESEPYSVRLINGVIIEFRTFDHPETLQGSGVDGMIVDERDYMPDRVWTDDLDPMLLDYQGWAMWISKPVKPRSLFAQWFELGQSSDYPNYYSSHATSADNEFIAEDPTNKRGSVPDYTFQQQYLAQLPDDSGQVFKSLGERLFTADYPLDGNLQGQQDAVRGDLSRPPSDCTPPFLAGVDFARHQDYRVTTVLDAAGELAYWSRAQNEAWDTIQSDIEAVHADYPGVVIPDASRDNKIVADLQAAGVAVDPVDFTPKRKKSLIEDLVTRVESGDLSLPDDHRLDQLRLELRQLERDVSEAGYTRYHAPETGYDDCVDSLALAASRLDDVRARSADADVDESGISYL